MKISLKYLYISPNGLMLGHATSFERVMTEN